MYFWLIAVLLYVPLLLLMVLSVNDSITLGFPLKGFTLRWYQAALDNPIMLDALRNSLLLAVVSAFVATILGSLAAMAIVRFRFPGRTFLAAVTGAPLVIPFVIVGAALLVALRWAGFELSLWTVGVGQVVLCIPLAAIIVGSGVVGFDQALEEASMDLGATYAQTQLLVTLPILAPVLIASFITCVVSAFNEFAISVFLVGIEPVLPVYLYSQLRNTTSGPLIMAVASAVILTSFALVLVAWALQGGTRRGGRATPGSAKPASTKELDATLS